MKDRKRLESLIEENLFHILERSKTLAYDEEKSIKEEYKEWLQGVISKEDIWVINSIRPKKEY